MGSMHLNIKWASTIVAGSIVAASVFAQDARRDGRLTAQKDYYQSLEPLTPGVVVGAPTPYNLGPNDPRALAPGRTSVLVYMEPTLERHAPQRSSVKALAQQKGGIVKHEYDVLPNVLNLRDIPESAIKSLENLPGVMKVEIDEYHPNLLSLHDSTALIHGLQSQISGAGLSADGTGVRVCVCDTGIDSDHVMYASRIDTAAGRDFYNNDNNPEDDNGHGSHVSGIAVGGTGLSVDFGCGAGDQPFQGVAPNATLIGAKILNSGGGGFDSDIIAGINYCADQSGSGGRADVINLSIGVGQFSGNCTHSWAVAANNAVASGVVVVAASGNENYSNSLSSPACGANVIAVGATWKADYPTCEDSTTNWNWGICTDFGPQEDEVGCFSNESDLLDVSAPGLNIWSASNSTGGSSIVGQSGTSMASPAVAGLAALILDADGSLSPAEVRQLIRDGATDLGSPGFDRGYGYGRIDVVNTLALVTPCSSNGDCDDGLWCNGSETCSAGSCQAGTPIDCDDGVDCTDDSCNEGSQSCDHTPNGGGGSACNNGVCEPGEDCQNCAADCRSKQNGSPNSRYCCDGDLPGCGDARCSESGWSCGGGGSPTCCGDGTCETGEDGTNCPADCACQSAGDCDDGNACTIDACTGGLCSNTPIDCDDGDACTTDSCSGGTCSHDPVDCDDSDACTTDSCNSGSGCVNTPPACQDNDGCCPSGCNDTNDNDCGGPCGERNDPCTSGADCCSGLCKGNGRCK